MILKNVKMKKKRGFSNIWTWLDWAFCLNLVSTRPVDLLVLLLSYVISIHTVRGV